MRNRLSTLIGLLCLLLGMATGAQAGTPYQTAVGTPPVITKQAWRTWYLSLLAFRLNECPVARATTYYFSQSGNDSTGSGTQSAPYKTIAKANALLQASSGNLALLFKRGDVWQHETTAYAWTLQSTPTTGQASVIITPIPAATPMVGDAVTLTGGTSETLTVASYVFSTYNNTLTLTFTANVANSGHTGATWTGLSSINITKSNVTVGAWGNGLRKPLFSAFQGSGTYKASTVTTASTRGDAYLHTFSQSEASTVAAVREYNDVQNPFRKVASIAQVDATPGSWWQDTTAHIIYLHDLDDVGVAATGSGSNSGRNFEPVYANNAQAVTVQDVDSTRIDGLRIDGYGAKAVIDPNGARTYGIKGIINGTNACVVSNSECYFSDNHDIGILGASYGANAAYTPNPGGSLGGGGFIAYFRDKAGWDTTFDTPFVCYNGEGGQQVLVHECECPGPYLPSGLQFAEGTPFTEHAAAVTPGSYATGQPSLTLSDAGAWANAPFVPGESVTLTGGTSETLTVASYNPTTGLLTFTGSIANGGHTGLTFASGPLSGTAAQYASGLAVMYGCRNAPGPYQAGVNFGGPQMPPRWTDLANCRSWDVGETFRSRPRVPLDLNTVTMPLTAASQGAATVTVTTPSWLGVNTTLMQGQWVTLSGGSSPAESAQIGGSAVNINTSTGVVTFTSGNLVGSGRTEMRASIGRATTSSNFLAAVAFAPSTAVVNGWFEANEPWGVNGGSSFVNGNQYPGSSTLFLNCTFINDFHEVSDPSNGNQKRAMYAYPSASASAPAFYNCRFHTRVGGRDLGGIDTLSLAGTASPLLVYNSILSGEYEEGGVVAGLGNLAANQINNAYAGLSSSTGVTGYTNDPDFVELSAPPAFGHPEPGSPLITANSQLVQGVYRLEYDADWQTRSVSTPAIGPYDPLYNTGIPPAAKSRLQ